MSDVGLVLVHGAWHGAATWDQVIPLLEAQGVRAKALDLPGAGGNARMPRAFFERPLDLGAFATEISPNAGVTQKERTDAVIAAIDETAEDVDKVILVGHSLGGLTVSSVAEAVPGKLSAVVYLTAFMLPPGMPAIAMIQHEKMAGELVARHFLSDPQATGALRLDTAPEDPDYRAGLKAAFYADLTEAQYAAALETLHCDEPAGVAVEPSPITVGQFGAVPRHYIRCTADNAIPIAGQDFMVASVDAAMGNTTRCHTMETSHSPFYSQPAALADILVGIARA
ncbi:alpha/beta fold hydrolase [Pelagibacterium halotolerans]|uniref:alpha/beta fold hydrolase n=1 Tax=Pelagibacterium halotolerans TaxID=531813 RepID=UPI0038510C98